MIKKLILIHVLLVLTITLSRVVLGFYPWRIADAVEVATALGAKVGCSGRFISGLDQGQLIEDLASYSPVNRQLVLDIDEAQKRVTASLWGAAPAAAQYRPGLGCTLEIGDTSGLDQIVVPEVVGKDAPWPEGSRVGGLIPAKQAQLAAVLARDNQAGRQTRALVMVVDGQIVAEAYAEGVDVDTPLLGWSMGKSVVAMMLGRMEKLGLLADSRPLFSEWREDARSEINLEHLLQMSSGLGFDESYTPGSDSTRMLFGAHSASGVALASSLSHPPGQRFAYSSGSTNLLARWLSAQLGGTQASVDFLVDELLRPLGMANTVFEPDPSGVFVGSSYIYASARDWARLGWLMGNEGRINGRQLLSPDWIARATAPNASENDPRYGYQFWLNGGGDRLRWPALPADAYFMTGNRKQYVMIVPSRKVVIVRLGWTRGGYPMAENFAELLSASSRS